jgi:hypothetical protein
MKNSLKILSTMFFGFTLGFSCYGMEDFDFDIPEEDISDVQPPAKKQKVEEVKVAEEDEISFDDMQALVDADSATQKEELLVYPPAPENKKPEKTEDPTVTAFRKSAMGLKSMTYDYLPEPLKNAFEEHVFEPVAKHIKDNFKLESMEFQRIPEVYTPEETKHAFLIIGNLKVYGQDTKAILREMTSVEGGKPHYSLTIEFTRGVKLSDLSNKLEIIDLDVKKLQLIFSDSEYEPEEKELKGITIKKGLNLVGDVQMTGFLMPINLLTKLKELRMFGTFKKGLVGSSLYGLIPGDLFLGKGVTLTKMMVGVNVLGTLKMPDPRFSLLGNVNIDIQGFSKKQKNTISLTSNLQLGKEKATLSGAMDGMWDNALGLKGFSIGNIGVGGSLLYAGGVLEGLELKGSVKLGDKIFDLATKGSVTEGAAFIGKLTGELSYKDIVNIANSLTGAGLDSKSIFKIIPNPSLKDVELQIIPVTTTIVGKDYPAGTKFEGTLSIFGKETFMKVLIFKDGLKGSAVLPEIKIPGLFTLKGTKKPDGTIQAPEVTLLISKSSSKVAEFYTKCFVQLAPVLLGGASADGFIDFSAAGTNIKMKSKLYNQFMFDIDLKSKGSLTQPPSDLSVKATMVADGGLGDLTKKIGDQLKKVFGDPVQAEKELKDNTSKCFKAKGLNFNI